ncbi:Smr-domain-containing protein [Dentipellis sp. KUC8613]|nr:Smr-domain-containing protein [Dentipellis sp. KUC8613]
MVRNPATFGLVGLAATFAYYLWNRNHSESQDEESSPDNCYPDPRTHMTDRRSSTGAGPSDLSTSTPGQTYNPIQSDDRASKSIPFGSPATSRVAESYPTPAPSPNNSEPASNSQWDQPAFDGEQLYINPSAAAAREETEDISLRFERVPRPYVYVHPEVCSPGPSEVIGVPERIRRPYAQILETACSTHASVNTASAVGAEPTIDIPAKLAAAGDEEEDVAEDLIHEPDLVDAHNFRTRAEKESREARAAFKESHKMWKNGDKASAKCLSEEGRAHQAAAEEFNKKASAAYFAVNNKGRHTNEIDLHNLRVAEAIQFAERSITKARKEGYGCMRIIVGKGLHSENGTARLKPELQEWLKKQNLDAEVQSKNTGVLRITLNAATA